MRIGVWLWGRSRLSGKHERATSHTTVKHSHFTYQCFKAFVRLPSTLSCLAKGFLSSTPSQKASEAKQKNKSNKRIAQSKFNHAGDFSRVSTFRLAAPWERRIPCSVKADHFRFQNKCDSKIKSTFVAKPARNDVSINQRVVAIWYDIKSRCWFSKLKTTGSPIIIRRRRTQFARLYFSRNIAAY